MPRKRRADIKRRTALTLDQEMALLFGDCDGPGAFTSEHRHLRSAFASPFLRLSAWRLHGAALTANWDTPGTRPWGYYHFELGEHPPEVGAFEQAAFLRERGGLLTDAEAAQLEAIETLRGGDDDGRRRRTARHNGLRRGG